MRVLELLVIALLVGIPGALIGTRIGRRLTRGPNYREIERLERELGRRKE